MLTYRTSKNLENMKVNLHNMLSKERGNYLSLSYLPYFAGKIKDLKAEVQHLRLQGGGILYV